MNRQGAKDAKRERKNQALVLASSAPWRFKLLSLGSLFAAATAVAACPDETTDGVGGSGAGSSEPAWQVIFDDGALDRALLGVWGTRSTSVYVVGGPLRNTGFTALALHFDGGRWRDLSVGGADTFWWVHGTSDADVWMVGERGRITHYDGVELVEHDSGTTATLWGVMAFSPTDVWAVGGMPGMETPDDVVLHFDGSAWTPVILPGTPLGRAHFKVWGQSSDDLFVVGEAGLIWHKQGASWNLESDPPVATGNLLTVHGCGESDVYAVGSRDLLSYDGATWTKVDRPLGNDVNGVHCSRAGASVGIVGMGGLKQRRVDGTWNDDFSRSPHGDLHGVWADETGALWAVGGAFVAGPKPDQPRNGIVARYGPGKVSTLLQ